MRVGILQPSYLPWIGYLDQIAHSDLFVFYDDVQFEKGSWRNRNRIATPSGPSWLTVPVLTKNRTGSLINEIEINNKIDWRKKHIRSIQQTYSKTPFFAEYNDQLFAYIENAGINLSELNIILTKWLCTVFGIKTEMRLSSETGILGRSTERLINILSHFKATSFYEGSAGRNYIDEPAFATAGINLEYQDYQHPVYNQHQLGNRPFIPYMSAVDLLFNHGPEGLSVIRSS